MKKQLLLIAVIVLIANFAFAQASSKPAAKPVLTGLEKKVSDMKFSNYEKINDSTFIIPYKQTSYKILLVKSSDLYVIFTDLSEAIPNKLTEAKYKYLLEKNNNIDFAKICMDEKGKFTVRLDVLVAGTSNANLKMLIEQVGGVTEEIVNELLDNSK